MRNYFIMPYCKLLLYAFSCLIFPSYLIPLQAQVQAQFQVNGMMFDGKQANQVVLGVTYNGQASRAYVNVGTSFPSGTTIITPEKTTISVFYKDQRQIVYPNSSLQLSINNFGVVAKSTGKVQHILNNVQAKVGFYQAGDGFTWAHARGTNFIVESANSKAKFSTVEGSVGIVEKVQVTINEASNSGANREGKTLETTRKYYSSAGNVYQTGNTQTVVYRTYADAVNAFVAKTLQKEKENNFYLDEIADDFFLIGRLFIRNRQHADAIFYLRKALAYKQRCAASVLETMDAWQLLAEALMRSSVSNYITEGIQMINSSIQYLVPLINPTIAEYNNAKRYNNKDLAWDKCFDVSDIYDFLDNAYDLLRNDQLAEFYGNKSDEWFERLDELEK